MPDIWMDVDTAVTVPVNKAPLVDATDFKTIEDNTIAYNAAGIEVIWHFVTTAGVMTSTPVTPTTGGVYDWTHSDGGVYKIEIPASGGASANNNAEGVGWITGKADACLSFSGPTIGFRAAALNNSLVDGSTALSTLTPAEVNAEVVDALNVDTYAEPGQEVPPATTTLVKKIGYLYKAFRNRKTQTSTTMSLYADDATTVDQKATISDNGTTYDHGEIGTGP